jgi:hypothetical protein
MPYDQAKKLTALGEYLEAVDVSDIKTLPYGAGRPPLQEEPLFAGSLMSYLWAYKANEPLGEFSPPETSTIAMPVTQDIFSCSFGTPNDLSIRFLKYNSNHTALKRVNYRYFRLDIPQGSVFLKARTIRHYIDYKQVLCMGDNIPELTPAYYPSFAEVINKYNNSGFFWAYLEGGKIVWKEGSTPANTEDFCILDHETLARPMLGANQVAVSQDYFDNAEHLIEIKRCRDLKYYRLRQAGKSGASDPKEASAPKDTMDTFAKKCKALDDAAEEALAKKHRHDGDGASGSGRDTNMT